MSLRSTSACYISDFATLTQFQMQVARGRCELRSQLLSASLREWSCEDCVPCSQMTGLPGHRMPSSQRSVFTLRWFFTRCPTNTAPCYRICLRSSTNSDIISISAHLVFSKRNLAIMQKHPVLSFGISMEEALLGSTCYLSLPVTNYLSAFPDRSRAWARKPDSCAHLPAPSLDIHSLWNPFLMAYHRRRIRNHEMTIRNKGPSASEGSFPELTTAAFPSWLASLGLHSFLLQLPLPRSTL